MGGTAGAASAAATANMMANTAGTPSSNTASPASNMPPSLPPITRVASVMTVSSDANYEFLGDAPAPSNLNSNHIPPPGVSYSAPSTSLGNRRPPPPPQSTAQPTVQSTPRVYSPPQINEPSPQQPGRTSESGFIGGVALANLRRQDLSTAAATAATVNASKRPSSSMSNTATSPTATTMSPPPIYGTPERRMSRSKPPPPPINTNLATRQYLSAQAANGNKDPRSGSKSASSFVTPTDLKSSAAAAAAAAATAANIANEAYNHSSSSVHTTASSSAASAAAAANARTKKSLPFLRKNPVSTLLGRRKTGAGGSDMAGMSTANADGPVYVPIRGTRVHDFSAPGPRRVVPTDAPTATQSAAAAAAMAAIANAGGSPRPNSATTSPTNKQAPNTPQIPNNLPHPPPSLSSSSAEARDAASTPQLRPMDTSSAQLSHSTTQQTSSSSSYPSSRNSSVTPDATQNYVAPISKQGQAQGQGQSQGQQPQPQSVAELRGGPIRMPSQNTLQTLQTLQENRTLSFDEKPLPDRPTTSGDDGPSSSSVRTASNSTRSRVASTDVASLLKSSPSTGTTRSRNVSLSDDLLPNTNSTNNNTGSLPSTSATTPASVASMSVSAATGLPKHMKSTSSRFSFMIGSASEEMMLEERHRQKQAEKKATSGGDSDDGGMGPRDSRFDDFDEDGFDYDAMMDDDGLEERIPGVNADDEDEEDDAHLFRQENEYEEEDIPYGGLDDEDDVPEVGLSRLSLGGGGSNMNKTLGGNNMHRTLGGGDDEPTLRIEPEDDDPEGVDPDNDQENFAGFVFQRSNPASSLVSPTSAGVVPTPRDAAGRAIGFAVTMDATPDLNPPSATSLSSLDAQGNLGMMMNTKVPGYGDNEVTDDDGAVAGAGEDTSVDDLGIQHSSSFNDVHASFEEDDNQFNGDDYGGDDDYYEDMGQYDDDLQTAETTVTFQPQQTPAIDQEVPAMPNVQPQPPAAGDSHGDDLYYDQGLVDELDFGQPESSGAAFDESIFDIDDTDQYGRPIPGAFAAAQAAQRAAMAAAIEAASGSGPRESDVPSSEMSDKSQGAESTAHTSMSVAGMALASGRNGPNGRATSMHSDNQSTGSPSMPMLSSQFASARKSEDSLTALRRQLPPIMTDAERVDAYQAALAAAAYKAAASGKFRRDSSSTRFSPEPTSSPPTFDMDDIRGTGLGLQGLSLGPEESIIDASSPVATSEQVLGPHGDLAGLSGLPGSAAHLAYAFTSERDMDYQYDFDDDTGAYTQDMDDYDLDDDAIIAEANAEALANDMDGFYGQEFNFYSAPVQQSNLRNSSSNNNNNNNSGGDKDQVQYANGGYFIPAGVGRSISGRVVSREPNLTPITERSEYSNRNSVMSLAVPQYGSSAELRSPGLQQLIALAESGDNSEMSYSALMRLRSRAWGGSSSVNSSREGSPMLAPGGVISSFGNNSNNIDVRERGDRENASSPFAGPTPSQLQLINKQYPLPAQYHHRMASGGGPGSSSFSPRGAASSGLNSENGSDCGSPTLTSLMPVNSGGSGIGFAGNNNMLPLPTSPIPPAVSSGGSSCPPVLEEEDEMLAEHDGLPEIDTAATQSAGGVSGISSASGSMLWMRSPLQRNGSGANGNNIGANDLNNKHVVPEDQRQQLRQKQMHDSEVLDLEQQLQVKARETEQMQMQLELLRLQQLQLQLQQQKQQQQQQQQQWTEVSPISPARGPPPPIPPMSSRRPGRGHRHKGSSDSISYVKEEEAESGESRWVMERRRVDESGESELLEREVMDRI
ncbi:hypothetical protein Sste5346_008726 [Sporothrix stenoceras]|uniref:AGC-kinase C-terminal domain-containing protein n=1 Tax=Sporothrix stenoceras TaxID=5173 RepID=A0ABR3YPD4_9PEZI